MGEKQDRPEVYETPREIMDLRESAQEIEGILGMAESCASDLETEAFLAHHVDIIRCFIDEAAELARRFGEESIVEIFSSMRPYASPVLRNYFLPTAVGVALAGQWGQIEITSAIRFLASVRDKSPFDETRLLADERIRRYEHISFQNQDVDRLREIAAWFETGEFNRFILSKISKISGSFPYNEDAEKLVALVRDHEEQIKELLDGSDDQWKRSVIRGIWNLNASHFNQNYWFLTDRDWYEKQGFGEEFVSEMIRRYPVEVLLHYSDWHTGKEQEKESVWCAIENGRYNLEGIWPQIRSCGLERRTIEWMARDCPQRVFESPVITEAVSTHGLGNLILRALFVQEKYYEFLMAPEGWLTGFGKTKSEIAVDFCKRNPRRAFYFFKTEENRTAYSQAFEDLRKCYPLDELYKDVVNERSISLATERNNVGRTAWFGYFPWASRLSDIEKRQARTKNTAHDPWRTDLAPLVRTLFERGVLSPEDPGDVDYVTAFIDDFGMVNAPRLFELCVALWKADRLENLGDAHKKMVGDLLGARASRMRQGAEVVNAIRAWRRDALRGLLRDQIPGGIESELGAEIFSTMLGSTSWGKGGKGPAEVMAVWKETTRTRPEAGVLPEGYAEKSIRVAVRDRSGVGDRPDAEAARAKILENADLRARLDAFRTAARESRQPPYLVVESARRDLLEGIDRKLGKLSTRLESARGPAASAMARQRETLEKQRKEVENALASREWTAGEAVAALISLGGLGLDADAFIRTASAADMRARAPEAFARTFDDLATAEGVPTESEVGAAAELIEKYVREHYLRSPFDGGDGEHAAAWADLGVALTEAWQLSDPQHPVLVAAGRLRDLGRGAVTRKAMDVALVPVRSALRLYAGDIGDACYAAKHELFARGDYPGIQTVLFVTGRNTPNERLNGSALFIETEDADGGRVLVVRANNPRENLLQQVDGDALIGALLDEARATAARRGIPRVGIVLDGASQASSNRSDVADYYARHFSARPRIRLRRSHETIFNGYGIWDDQGKHPVVEI